MQQPDDPVALYGTEEPVTPPVELRAGPLTAELEAGNLRHIRLGGVEVIRGIAFLVRDRHWGTYAAKLDDLVVDQGSNGFTVTYAAEVRDAEQSFRFRARIEGSPDSLRFSAEGAAGSDFVTNRTGFVVLHPVTGVAGAPVAVEHVDGSVEQTWFPELIDPVQPMLDLRALTHEPAPGLRVLCRMEDDTFEMEDQRNWCDASYKTYVRPLSRPWPYRLEAGQTLQQSVSLAITGPTPRTASSGDTVTVTVGEPAGPAPILGLGFDPSETEATRRVLPHLAELGARMLVCHYDPRRGHDRTTLEAALEIAAALGAEPRLEAVIDDVAGYGREIEALASTVRELGSPFRSVLLTPAADLKSTTPGQPWPAAPPPAEFYRVARDNFPGVRLGGGMASAFTELNRKRPPLDHLDFVTFTTMALVHACDDVSVIEGLEALPSIARSASAIAGGLPIEVGPSAIGLRLNPYGPRPVPNPDNRRQAMAWNDPRQRGQLGAAWAIGYYARLAREGVQAITFGGTTGAFGVVHTKQSWPTPGCEGEGTPYPIFDALRELARLSGKTLRRVDVSEPSLVEAVAAEDDSGITLLVTNLTVSPRSVEAGGRITSLPPFASVSLRL